MRVFLLAEAALAAVARDELTLSVETVDGQAAVVGAALAVGTSGGVLQSVDLIDGKHGCFPALAAVSGDEGGAEGTHDAGDIRPDGFAVRDALKAAKDRVVVEGAALHDDVLSELRGVGDLDDLIQRVLDDGVGEAGRDVGDGRAFLLGLLDLGIHEDRAARAQVDRVFREQGFLREILHGDIEGLRECLDKGAAAGGAGLVELHRVDALVLDLDAFHVLTADVQDAVDLRIKEGGGRSSGRWSRPRPRPASGRLDQLLAVAGGAGIGDLASPAAWR